MVTKQSAKHEPGRLAGFLANINTIDELSVCNNFSKYAFIEAPKPGGTIVSLLSERQK